MNKTGLVICSRTNSSRIKEKPFHNINGKPVLEHLLRRLKPLQIETCLAVPMDEGERYKASFEGLFDKMQLGFDEDPLSRMYHAAEVNGYDTIVRICHDKVFISPDIFWSAINVFKSKNLDYLYSSSFMDGTAFEIISFDALKKAKETFKNIEHISYAVRAVTDNQYDLHIPLEYRSKHRLLIDYPEDITALELIFNSLGNDCSLEKVIKFLNENEWISNINRLPLVSVYTCGYNASKWLPVTLKSVRKQSIYDECEYILVDDFSDDSTAFDMGKFYHDHPNVKFIRNSTNVGLASSSNIALKHAKGKYIVRLDADDFFPNEKALQWLYEEIESRDIDVIYPNNYYGDVKKVQNGKDQHHVGGTIFKTRGLNHIKFTDGLRGYEGLDLFERAREQLKIGYLNKAVFFYRQHKHSMSKTNLEERENIKREIYGRKKMACNRHNDALFSVRS